MDPQFWLERWQSNQIGFHREQINPHLAAFWSRLRLPAAAPVFVPLCGKSRDLLWLRAQGHPVLGIELSPIAVRDFFAENALAPEVTRAGAFERWEYDGLAILRGDFFDLTAHDLRAIAGVYDRASLVALPPPMRVRYAAHLAAILPPRAETLLVTMDYPDDEMQGPPFAVPPEEVERLYGARHAITPLFSLDVLAAEPKFRERGVTRMVELVYRLSGRDG